MSRNLHILLECTGGGGTPCTGRGGFTLQTLGTGTLMAASQGEELGRETSVQIIHAAGVVENRRWGCKLVQPLGSNMKVPQKI